VAHRRESIAERRAARAEVDDPAVVLEAALRFLEARARSETEVRRRLTSAGYRVELVDGAVARLAELGILDDEAFARAWIESRDRARPRGERALEDELRLRGLDRTVIANALADRRAAAAAAEPGNGATASSADELAAERLLQRNARALARVVDPRARRQRAYALLARNGFDPGVCATMAARAVEADDTQSD
jgi:regulatory protein